MTIPECLALLRAAFPRQEFPPTSVQIYARALADLEDADVEAAARTLICRAKFLPSIAEIRREVAEHMLALPTATEAWLMVSTPAGRAGAPPPVKAAVAAIGGPWELAHGTAETMERRFRRAYDEIREGEIRLIAERRPPGLMVGSQPRDELTAGEIGAETAAAIVEGLKR